jgi:hypothetical protein
MKLSHVTVTLVAAMACLGSAACSKDKNADATTTAASVAATADKPAEKAAAAPAELPLDQFLTKAVPAACKTIAECKNDKMKVATTMPVMLIAGFGTIDKPELGNEVKAVNTSMKADKRFVPNEKECTTLGGVAMKVLGMQADALNGKVGKTIAYDAKKAATCVDSLSKAPDACGTEVKLANEPKMSEMEGFSKELKPALDGFAKPCEDVITGLVDAGGACELDVECKGKGAKCKPAKGGRGAKAEAKTCQVSGTAR